MHREKKYHSSDNCLFFEWCYRLITLPNLANWPDRTPNINLLVHILVRIMLLHIISFHIATDNLAVPMH
ncbi:MAG: hypothetical protein ACFE9J_15710 [Candidatus Hermodarchaeota archaeon]